LAEKLKENDVFLGITTSGRSPNILWAMEVCRAKSVKSIVLTGRDRGAAKGGADYCIIAPGEKTSTISGIAYCARAHAIQVRGICIIFQLTNFQNKG